MTRLSRTPFLLLAVVAMLAFAIVASPASAGDAEKDRAQVQKDKARVAAEIDTLRATDSEVEPALATLNANVSAQTSALREAERKAVAAEQALADAQDAVVAKRAEIDVLSASIRSAAVEAFIRPPGSDLATSLQSDSIGEAEVKQTLLDARSESQLDLLDQLDRAREDLETAERDAEIAAGVAENQRAAVSTKLTDVTNARDQQATLAANVQDRLDRKLGEAASLAELDKQLSAEIAAEQKRLAAELAKAAPAPSAPSAPSVNTGGTIAITGSGSIVSVRGIRVHKSIANNVANLLAAAEADGIVLSGGGYRSSQGQINTRRNNCGTSNYAIYQMPAGQCRPPTARPGSSMHEKGLAIDFTYRGRIINSRSSPAYQWMRANVASYGLYNLPSEPWHWSTNGR